MPQQSVRPQKIWATEHNSSNEICRRTTLVSGESKSIHNAERQPRKGIQKLNE